MTDKNLTKEQSLQEEQYDFPYHYLPVADDGQVSFTRFWGWALSYLGRIELIKKEVSSLDVKNYLDIGCGDGRLINILSAVYKDINFEGIDYSEQAISLARIMNHAENTKFHSGDINKYKFGKKFDVISFVEVLEHIEASDLTKFIESSVANLEEKGHVIITVPSVNLPLCGKHYQHFTIESISEEVEKAGLKVKHAEYIDGYSPFMRFLSKFLYNRLFMLNHKGCQKFILNYYLEKHLRNQALRGEGVYLLCHRG